MRRQINITNKGTFKKYSTLSVYDKLLKINVPEVEAKKISIANVSKGRQVEWESLKNKYKPKNLEEFDILFKYAIYENMIYEIDYLVHMKISSKGRYSYYLKLKHLKEVYLFSRKKCFKTYEEAVTKKKLLLEGKQ